MRYASMSLLAVLIVAACAGGGQQTEAPPATGAPTNAPTQSPLSATVGPTPSPFVATPLPAVPTATETDGAAGHSVTIANFAFNPATLQVGVGDTVTWTNSDSAAHTVTFEEGPNSGALETNDTFEHTFEAAGEFNYICSIHPSMQGKVSVGP